MSRRNESITLSIGEGHKARLEAIAVDFGCTYGNKPNVSGLLKRLADGELRLDYAEAAPADNPKRAAILGALSLIQEGIAKLMRLL